MNGVLTTNQVAKELNITPYSVRRLLRDGFLKGFKIGGHTEKRHWRIKQQDLEAFIDGNSQQAGAESEHNRASK